MSIRRFVIISVCPNSRILTLVLVQSFVTCSGRAKAPLGPLKSAQLQHLPGIGSIAKAGHPTRALQGGFPYERATILAAPAGSMAVLSPPLADRALSGASSARRQLIRARRQGRQNLVDVEPECCMFTSCYCKRFFLHRL